MKSNVPPTALGLNPISAPGRLKFILGISVDALKSLSRYLRFDLTIPRIPTTANAKPLPRNKTIPAFINLSVFNKVVNE